MELIIGNLCSIAAMVSDACSATRNNTRGILLFQTLSQFFYGVGAMLLKGYSGVVQNVVSVIRNLSALGTRRWKTLEWMLALAAVGFGLLFNNRGLVGLLPVVANLEYTVAVFRFRDRERLLKGAFLLNAVMYGVFNTAIYNFAGAAANVVVIITTAAALLKKP